jgi:hypothetical protein
LQNKCNFTDTVVISRRTENRAIPKALFSRGLFPAKFFLHTWHLDGLTSEWDNSASMVLRINSYGFSRNLVILNFSLFGSARSEKTAELLLRVSLLLNLSEVLKRKASSFAQKKAIKMNHLNRYLRFKKLFKSFYS